MLRDAVRVCAAVVLLAGSVVLAFFSGGYFAEPRLWAGLTACALVVAAALAAPRPLPRALPGRLALAGLAALAGLTALSMTWAPLAGPAFADTQRLLLYLAALVAATAVFRGAALERAVAPAVAAGLLVVVGYGLAGRLLPELVDQTPSLSAAGRLDQPLTYWNAMGAVAAVGLVLAAGLATDPLRARVLRVAAAAAAAPFGMAIYVTYSRGALVAAAAGILVLVVRAADRRRLTGIAVVVGAAGVGALAAAALPGVASLEGQHLARDGAIGLVLLALTAAAAGALQRRLAARERPEPQPIGLPHARIAAAVAGGALAALAVVAVAASERRPGTPETGARAGRLVSLESHRYEYWQVAAGAFADHPLRGIGSGNFRVRWLREREVPESARDAHSLYLETAAELGLAGLAGLAAVLAGAIAAVRRLGADAAVPAAGLAAWAVQAGIDWLWEMPAVTLPALSLLALLIARADAPTARPAPPPRAPLAPAPPPPGSA